MPGRVKAARESEAEIERLSRDSSKAVAASPLPDVARLAHPAYREMVELYEAHQNAMRESAEHTTAALALLLRLAINYRDIDGATLTGMNLDKVARDPSAIASPKTEVSNHLSDRNILIAFEKTSPTSSHDQIGKESEDQSITNVTGLPTRLSISTSVSMVNLAVFLFITSETRGRETIKTSAASACFK